MIYNLQDLTDALTQNKIRFVLNEPMSRHTSFKIGGNADVFAAPSTAEQLAFLQKLCGEIDVPYFVMGKGSNLLVSDRGIEGVVITTDALNKITVTGNTVECGAGTALSALCNAAAKKALTGIEFAYGIPGSVGGAVYMNAGAYGGEIADVIESAQVLTKNGEIKTLSKDELGLGYRKSVLKRSGDIVISACFNLKGGNSDEIYATMNDIMKRRKEKQPLEWPSAGSTFKRPQGNFAGTLIEQCGLKGQTVGGAMVSRKHAGFIINSNCASAQNVKDLICIIQDTVYQQTGVPLETEVIFVGRD